MIYKLRVMGTYQTLHFIFQTGIRWMHHHFMISAQLLADRALLNLEALHASVDIRELRGVIELIVFCVFEIVVRLARN